MGFGIKLLVFGQYACFTRPEFKTERVSYDVMTPTAARGILEAIYWKPAISWKIDRIHVLNKIKHMNIKRNEVGSVIGKNAVSDDAMSGKAVDAIFLDPTVAREQRQTLMLRDVAYVIEAHFDMTERAGERDSAEKHYAMFTKRATKGGSYKQPYFGCREFAAYFELLAEDATIPKSHYDGEDVALGYMLFDINYANGMEPVFFDAHMKNGIIEIPNCSKEGGETA